MKTVIAFAMATIAIAVACSNTKQPPVAAAVGVADSADQTFYGMHFLLTTKGIQRGDLTADTAYVLDETSRFDLRHAHVNFTSETGAPDRRRAEMIFR